MDHALVCGCGGDKTLRHNAARGVFHEDAQEAGLRSEREKAGLLPPRPEEESLRAEKTSNNGRRPADVWIASWKGGRPAAIDFAVTSGLRADRISTAESDPASVWGSYE